jgi:uncharacterized RDD family membrane protein YckC
MKCAACGWSNPASYTSCFSCKAALSGMPAATPALPAAGRYHVGTAQNTPKKTPWDPLPQARTHTHALGTVDDGDVIAGKLQRIFAAAIDLAVMAVLAGLAIAAMLALGIGFNDTGLTWLAALLAALLVVIAILLPALLDSFSAGSMGKRLLNLRVINARGERPGVLRSVLRHLIKYTSHFMLPLGLIVIEKLFFGGRSLHDLLMSTRVLDRRASARQIEHIVASEFGPTVVGAVFKIVAFAVVATASVVVSVILFNVFIDTPNPARTATREATQALAKSAKSLAKQSENIFYAQGTFPSSLSALGLATLPNDFAAVQFNQTSGAFTLTLSEKLTPELQGKTLTLFPEFKQKKGAGSIKKWRCGSKDIARDLLPFGCRDDVALLN